MTLATRELGSRGPQITTVGFGAWAIGGGGWAYGWGAQDDATSVAALIHAVSRGVNWVDLSGWLLPWNPGVGPGRSVAE